MVPFLWRCRAALHVGLLLLVTCLGGFTPAIAQTILSGQVNDEAGNSVSFATVNIRNTGLNTSVDEKGKFQFIIAKPGSYTVEVGAVGFVKQSRKVEVKSGETTTVKFGLKESTQMNEVTVQGRTATEEVNRQAYNISAIDATKLHNTTLDLAHALDRVSGVRIRESGGVGSSMSFSINGFSGRQVRIFIDGVPMDDFGSSFQLNNIPINLAERLEVYKGVVPVGMGSDALGGAVNIVTGNKMRNYLDVSYSYGSFNTHRTVVNTAVTSKNGLTFQLNAFQNYSDNNYKVTMDIADINTGAYTRNRTVRKFHEKYHNETVIANVGFVGKSWADRLLFGITLGKNYREIQTGARMESVFGAWHTRGNIVMPTIKYGKKDLFVKGLDVVLSANYNLGRELNIDTAFRRYDWYGNYKEYGGTGAERQRQMYNYANNVAIAVGTINYRINDQQSLALSNTYSSFDRKGYDELDPDQIRLAQPQIAKKNVTGLSYKYDLNRKWSSTVFGKYYILDARTRQAYTLNGSTQTQYLDAYNKVNDPGFGLATTYYINSNLQAKGSYERAIRLPESTELFGDLVNEEANFSLKPERSHNVNLGLTYNFRINEDHKFLVEVTGNYQYAYNFIQTRPNSNQTKLTRANIAGVRNIGGEFEMRYDYKKRFSIEANGTYQDIRNMEKYEPGATTVSSAYKVRMPNLPFLYGHASANVFFDNVLLSKSRLTVGYNLLYVYPFYLRFPAFGTASTKYDVPEQLSHDLNMVYAFKDGRYNVALECRNLTNKLLFDNFSLQKPSRSFTIKLRYFISK